MIPSRNYHRRVERIGGTRAIAINRQITHCAGTLAAQGAVRIDFHIALNPVGDVRIEGAIIQHHIVPRSVRIGKTAAQAVLVRCAKPRPNPCGASHNHIAGEEAAVVCGQGDGARAHLVNTCGIDRATQDESAGGINNQLTCRRSSGRNCDRRSDCDAARVDQPAALEGERVRSGNVAVGAQRVGVDVVGLRDGPRDIDDFHAGKSGDAARGVTPSVSDLADARRGGVRNERLEAGVLGGEAELGRIVAHECNVGGINNPRSDHSAATGHHARAANGCAAHGKSGDEARRCAADLQDVFHNCRGDIVGDP
ncbi:MAG: hypothetical protein EBR81_16195 [Proteobacteria bacterium]|nr:hypothetical protein [Pseudomonadota bacterium]